MFSCPMGGGVLAQSDPKASESLLTKWPERSERPIILPSCIPSLPSSDQLRSAHGMQSVNLLVTSCLAEQVLAKGKIHRDYCVFLIEISHSYFVWTKRLLWWLGGVSSWQYKRRLSHHKYSCRTSQQKRPQLAEINNSVVRWSLSLMKLPRAQLLFVFTS